VPTSLKFELSDRLRNLKDLKFKI